MKARKLILSISFWYLFVMLIVLLFALVIISVANHQIVNKTADKISVSPMIITSCLVAVGLAALFILRKKYEKISLMFFLLMYGLVFIILILPSLYGTFKAFIDMLS